GGGEQRIVGRQDRAAGQAEYDLRAEFLQREDERPGTGDLAGNRRRYRPARAVRRGRRAPGGPGGEVARAGSGPGWRGLLGHRAASLSAVGGNKKPLAP